MPSGAESEAEESGLNQESDESEEEGQERVGGNPLGQVPDSQPLLGDVDMLEESLALFETPKKKYGFCTITSGSSSDDRNSRYPIQS